MLANPLLSPTSNNHLIAGESESFAAGDEQLEVIFTKWRHSSAEPFAPSILLSNLSVGQYYLFEWMIIEGNGTASYSGIMVRNDSINFNANATNKQINLTVSHFSTDFKLYRFLTAFSSSTGMIATSENGFGVFRQSIAPSFSDFIIFGDSLSDAGNSYAAWGTPDSPPYWQGRFSNGAMWGEQIHDWMGLPSISGRDSASGNNRAFGGASSGNGLSFWTIPNTGKQVDDYLNSHSVSSSTAVGIWAGGNDFLNFGQTNVQTVVDNLQEHTMQLLSAGATDVLLFEMPPLEKVPEMRDDSQSDKDAMHELMLEFNSKLSVMATNVALSQGVNISVIPVWSDFEMLYWNSFYLDVVNVSHAACEHGGVTCSNGDPIAPNAHQYVFFDDIHPTLTTHELMARGIMENFGVSDYDGDGVADSDDQCPFTSLEIEVTSEGCPVPPPDSDNDGVPDADDDCPNTDDGLPVDEDGCAINQRDTDGDGVSDAEDQCNDTPAGALVNAFGCSDEQLDTDGDGVNDAEDDCPLTASVWDVDDDGCADYQKDTDEDGVTDDSDACGDTPRGEVVNIVGCSASQLDTDQDGVSNALDICPGTAAADISTVDENGCSDLQRDSDEDGVSDDVDLCPNTEWLVNDIDENGCSDTQRDTDGDGPTDADDDCPTTPGTIRGCPILAIEVILTSPLTSWDQDANLTIIVSCETGCVMRMSGVNLPWFTLNTTNGTRYVDISGPGPLSKIYDFRVEVESAWAEDSVSITWPAPPDEPDGGQNPDDDGGDGGDDDNSVGGKQNSGGVNINPMTIIVVMVMLILNGLVAFAILGQRKKKDILDPVALAAARFEAQIFDAAENPYQSAQPPPKLAAVESPAVESPTVSELGEHELVGEQIEPQQFSYPADSADSELPSMDDLL
jgi:phospholipase/lecithinase/hemolysin